jgi:hypothetical protein
MRVGVAGSSAWLAPCPPPTFDPLWSQVVLGREVQRRRARVSHHDGKPAELDTRLPWGMSKVPGEL